jgi:hypothetical protein
MELPSDALYGMKKIAYLLGDQPCVVATENRSANDVLNSPI